MKRFWLFWAALGLCLGSVWADETVKAVQTQLKERGFYYGSLNGVYDSDTSAAVTRYQIRNGLAISGKLDAATLSALHVQPSANKAAPEASPIAGTWRQLRNGDMQFLRALNSGKIAAPASPPPDNSSESGAAAVSKPARKAGATAKPAVVPPRAASEEEIAARAAPGQLNASQERLRDYVGAFVLAGLDPHTGAELEFFADRVDYFGERNVAREKVRRDLVSYAQRWPDRRFWLAGDLKITRRAHGEVSLTFPLRYDLRRGHRHAAGQVLKTIVLQKSGRDDFKIVAVNERKES